MSLVDLNAIKHKLENTYCQKCNQNPDVSISEDRISLSCCCEDFKNELAGVIKNEAEAQSKKTVKEEIKLTIN